MNWTVGQVTVDFSQNLAVVVFNRSGGTQMNAMSINVSFPVVANNQPPPDAANKKDLIARAQQLLTEAANR